MGYIETISSTEDNYYFTLVIFEDNYYFTLVIFRVFKRFFNLFVFGFLFTIKEIL